MQAQKLFGTHQMAFSSLQSHYGNPFSPTTTSPPQPPSDHLANIKEDDAEPTPTVRPANYERTTQSVLGASMGM